MTGLVGKFWHWEIALSVAPTIALLAKKKKKNLSECTGSWSLKINLALITELYEERRSTINNGFYNYVIND